MPSPHVTCRVFLPLGNIKSATYLLRSILNEPIKSAIQCYKKFKLSIHIGIQKENNFISWNVSKLQLTSTNSQTHSLRRTNKKLLRCIYLLTTVFTDYLKIMPYFNCVLIMYLRHTRKQVIVLLSHL